jgi:hypothetical protein
MKEFEKIWKKCLKFRILKNKKNFYEKKILERI